MSKEEETELLTNRGFTALQKRINCLFCLYMEWKLKLLLFVTKENSNYLSKYKRGKGLTYQILTSFSLKLS